MTSADTAHQQDLVLRACAGDQTAFEALLLEHQPKLRSVIRRMVGHPEDTDDLVQESIIRAWNSLGSFRRDASFGTWLCSIGVRQAIDHLRKKKRWRVEAQVVYSNECFKSPELQAEVIGVLSDPAFVYEAEEHIAYCFTCVGRSLPPEDQAVLVLREVMGMTAREAASALGITDSVLRHRLTSARNEMEQRYEGLCSLVNKRGVCYQCKGLRDATPAPRQGRDLTQLRDLDERLDIVRRANVDEGATQAMHDLFWRRTKELEESGRGSPIPESDCGKE
jgi:RNA polymerase sigma-70 factor (ECF subfamily)